MEEELRRYRQAYPPPPVPVPPPDEEEAPEEEETKSALPEVEFTAKDKEAMFGVSGLADIGEPDDLSDLVEVTDEDFYGVEEAEPQPQSKPKKVLYRRTSQPYTPPETGMGEVRY